MTTSQLTAYIRAQSAAGASREAIRKALLLNEWSEQDIDAAFAAAAPPAPMAALTAPPSLALRKFILSAGFILISAVYAVWQNSGGQSVTIQNAAAPTPAQSYKAANDALLKTLAQINSAPATTPSSAPAAPQTSAPAQSATSMPAQSMMKKMGMYTDGSYTGSAADAYYGTVQVKAVITNGQLADVQFLQYPNTHSTSVYINEQAMPMLTQEALQAQSANVSGVSGATDTSMAFVQSLSSALAQAKS